MGAQPGRLECLQGTLPPTAEHASKCRQHRGCLYETCRWNHCRSRRIDTEDRGQYTLQAGAILERRLQHGYQDAQPGVQSHEPHLPARRLHHVPPPKSYRPAHAQGCQPTVLAEILLITHHDVKARVGLENGEEDGWNYHATVDAKSPEE